MSLYTPKRIICLSDEATEILYLLGEEDRIVGLSCHTKRPLIARKEKPVVTSFSEANIEKILALAPDLVIGFSDVQAEIARTLIIYGLNVLITNPRTIEDIFSLITLIGNIVNKTDRAQKLVDNYKSNLENTYQHRKHREPKPAVYFEEWDSPLISGICWVSELIEYAGGRDIFSHLRTAKSAKERIINPYEVVRKNPDIIFASWCGKKFNQGILIKRDGWNHIKAVVNNFTTEIDSSIILQPGPAALTEGFSFLVSYIDSWYSHHLPTL